MEQVGRKKWWLLLLFLLVLNYVAIPPLLKEYPVSSHTDLNLSEINSGLIDIDFLYNFYVDGDDGYLITYFNESSDSEEMAYYSQDCQLLWEKPLLWGLVELNSDFIVFIDTQGTYGDNFGTTIQVANITVMNKAGELISQFPIDLETFEDETLLNRGTKVAGSVLDQNTIYIVELTERDLLGPVSNHSIILHSYEIISGETNWIRKFDSTQLIGDYRLFDFRQSDSKFILSLKSSTIDQGQSQTDITRYELELDAFQYVVTSTENIVLSWNVYPLPIFMSEYEVLTYSYNSPSLYMNSSGGNEYTKDLGFDYAAIYGDNRLSSSTVAHLSDKEAIAIGFGFNGLTIDVATSFLIYIRSSINLRFDIYLMNETISRIKISDNKLFVMGEDGEKHTITVYQLTRFLLTNTLRNNLVHIIPSLILIPILLELSTRIIRKNWRNQNNQH